MWWGGGGGSGGEEETQSDSSSAHMETSSPIPIRGRGQDDPNESMASSVGSSVGSPSSDLAELRNIRTQFDDQEALLGQIREALQSGKKTQDKQDYASRLAQMRQSRRVVREVVSTPQLQPQPPSDKKTTPPAGEGGHGSGGKKNRIQALRKQLEESRARQEAETSNRRELEDIVASLQKEITKRDSMIASLQLSSVNSSVISSPFVMSPESVSPVDNSPGNITPPSMGYNAYSYSEQLSAKDNKILELNEQVADLGRKVFDLEENLKEKDQVIHARTQAVGLTAASLSAKGRSTVDQLEETRLQLRDLQQRWATQEGEFRREKEERRVEIESLTGKVTSLTEERDRLQVVRDELEAKGREMREDVGRLEEALGQAKKAAREDKIILEARIEELEEEKAKLAADKVNREQLHQARVKELEKRLREDRKSGSDGGSDEESEGGKRVELEIALAELEEEKGNLQLKILELEESAANEIKFKNQLAEADEEIRRFQDDLDGQTRAVSMLESEKLDLMEAVATRDDLLNQRVDEMSRLAGQLEELGRTRVTLEMRCLELEEQKDRWEGEKLELVQTIEAEKLAAREAVKPLEALQEEHDKLKQDHDKFQEEYTAALDKSKLYDKDLVDKFNKIKELKIEMETLEKLLEAKNLELTDYFGQIEAKETELTQLRSQLEQVGSSLEAKDDEIAQLKETLAQSEDHQAIEMVRRELSDALRDKESTLDSVHALEEAKYELEAKISSFEEQLDNQRHETEAMMEEKLIDLENKKQEWSNEKEALNSRIEDLVKENKQSLEKVDELQEQIAKMSKDLERSWAEMCAMTETHAAEKSALQEDLDATKTRLEDTDGRLVALEKTLQQKTDELTTAEQTIESQSKQLADIQAELESTLAQVKDGEAASVEKGNEVALLTTQISELSDKLSLKEEEVSTLNEDILGKYKIIEELQAQYDEMEAKKQEVENDFEKVRNSHKMEADAMTMEIERLKDSNMKADKEASEANDKLKAMEEEKAGLNNQVDSLRNEVSEKSASLETLQTVVDVLKAKDVEDTNEAVSNLEEKLTDARSQLSEKSAEVEPLNQLVEDENNKVMTLENEKQMLAEKSDMLERQIAEVQLQHQAELAARVTEVKLTSSLPAGVDLEDQVRLQQEQIEMLRHQLKEKAELLERNSDDDLRLKVEELSEQLELRTQELEDIRTLMRKSEAEKEKLNERLAEADEFRAELVRESNQHAEQAGDKIKELREKLEAKDSELAALEEKVNEYQARIDSDPRGEASISSNAAAGQLAALEAERDVLKEKNDKLKDMCKKYLAKLKQREGEAAGTGRAAVSTPPPPAANAESSALATENEKLKAEVANLQQENQRLSKSLEEESNSLSALESSQRDLESKLKDIEQELKEIDRKRLNLEEKNNELEDLLGQQQAANQQLQDKLVSAPSERASGDPELEEALNKTKSELANMKEKCKKLIVKVKNQEQQLKQEREKNSAAGGDKPVTAHEESDTAARSEFQAELDRLRDILKRLEADLEATQGENGQLKDEIEDLRATHQRELESLQAKVEGMVKERTSLYDTQVSLKDEISTLRRDRQAALSEVERLQADLKKIREENLVRQLQSSAMLETVQQASGDNQQIVEEVGFGGFGEEDDGWGSPEPSKAAPHASQGEQARDTATQQMEQADDGWSEDFEGWGDSAAPLEQVADVEPTIEPAVAAGSAAEPAAPQQPPVSFDLSSSFRPPVGGGIEREADIEDGWGDDSWGGFDAVAEGTVRGAQGLAANLRLSEPKEEVSEEVVLSVGSSPGKPVPGQLSPRCLEFKSKLQLEEAAHETLEEEHNSLKARFDELEEEMNELRDAKLALEKQVREAEKARIHMEAQLEASSLAETEAKNKVVELQDNYDRAKERLEIELTDQSAELEKLQTQLSGHQAMEGVRADLELLRQQHAQLEEKLAEKDEELQQLENAKHDGDDRIAKLNAEKQQTSKQLSQLEAEVTRLTDDLEAAENDKSDLADKLRKLQERKNSLDSNIVPLQELESLRDRLGVVETELANKEAELNAIGNKLSSREADIEVLKRGEADLLQDRTWKLQEIESLKVKLEESVHKLEEVEEDKTKINQEVENLRQVVSDVSGENETLGRSIAHLQDQAVRDRDSIAQLQEQTNRDRDTITHLQDELLRHQDAGQARPPPPDVTHSGSQPDVARSSTRSQNPPDLMAAGQHQQSLDLVLGGGLLGDPARAADWFDSLDNGQGGDGWDMGGPVRVAEPQHVADQAPPVAHEQLQQEAANNEHLGDIVALQQQLDHLTMEISSLRSQLSESEARHGILERDKAVMEQSQTQLLAECKDFYEKYAKSDEWANMLQAKLDQQDKDLKERSDKIVELEQAKLALDALRDDHESLQARHRDLEVQLNERQTEISSLKATDASQKSDEMSVQAQMDNLMVAKASQDKEMEALRSQFDGLNAEISSLKMAKAELEAAGHQSAGLSQQIEEYRSSLEVKQSEIASLHFQIEGLNYQLEQARTASVAVSPAPQIQTDAVVTPAASNLLASFFDSPQPAAQSYFDMTPSPGVQQTGVLATPSPVVGVSHEEVSALKQTVDDLKAQLEAKAGELTVAANKLSAITSENETLERQRAEYESKIANLESQTEKLEETARAKCQLDNDIKQLTESLQDREREIARLNQSLVVAQEASKALSHAATPRDDSVASQETSTVAQSEGALNVAQMFDDTCSSEMSRAARDDSGASQVPSALGQGEGMLNAAQFFDNTSSSDMSSTAQLFATAGEVSQTAQLFDNTGDALSSAQVFDAAPSGTQSDAAQLFDNTSGVELPSTAQLFDNANQESLASNLFANVEPASMAVTDAFGASNKEVQSQSAVQETSAEPQVLGQLEESSVVENTAAQGVQEDSGQAAQIEWYSQELTNYQTALAQWQAWGEQKTAEVTQLQENLSSVTSELQSAQGQVDTLINEKKALETGDNKLQEIQKRMKIKDMELDELKETIDRLESEKVNLSDEVQEAMKEINELQSARDQMDAYKNTLDLLEETKLSLEKVSEERYSLKTELSQVKEEMARSRLINNDEMNQLQKTCNDKVEMVDRLQTELREKTSKLAELENSLEKERAMQEDVASEFDAMQKEVLNSQETIAQLNNQMEALQQQCQELKQSLASKEASKPEQTSQSAEPTEVVASNASEPSNLQTELDSYKQALTDWNSWAETKTSEYNLLLEAYNSYVEAFNDLNAKYSALQPGSGGDQTDKDQEIASLKAQLAEKETELVAKTGEIAKLRIQGKLGKVVIAAAAGQAAPSAAVHKGDSLSIVKQDEVSIQSSRETAAERLTITAGESTNIESTIATSTNSQSVGGVVAAQLTDNDGDGWADSEADVSLPAGDNSQASALTGDIIQLEVEISQLKHQLAVATTARTEAENELNTAKLKNGKLLLKVKTLTKEVEAIKSKRGTVMSTGSAGDDLDRALQEEMNNQVKKAESELGEVRREMERMRNEKGSMEKRIDTLESANERMMEMKERQDSEVEFLKVKNQDLVSRAESLEWQLAEMEEMYASQVSELKVSLNAYKEQSEAGTGEAGLMEDNTRLRNEVAYLTKQLDAAQQTIDSLKLEVTVTSDRLRAALDEAVEWKSKAEEFKDEVESLKLHIDSLQNEKGGSDAYAEAMALNENLNQEIVSLRHLIQSQQTVGDGTYEVETLREKLRREQQLVLQLEQDLQNKETALQQTRDELSDLRDCGVPSRMRRDSSDSRMSTDRELASVFMDQDVYNENQRLKTELDSFARESRRLSNRIASWEHEVGKCDSIEGEDSLREELRQAIKTLQIKEHKLDESTQENLLLLQERDTLQLKLSSVMRHMVESANNSRAMTPQPGGGQQHHLALAAAAAAANLSSQQLKELHIKLEELRKLNYARDVDLQRERSQSELLQDRVMAPRTRQASKMLDSTSDSPVKHL